jgi:integrase/recombinase XerD
VTKKEFLASDSGETYSALMRLAGLRPVTINNYARRIAVFAHKVDKAPQNLTCKDIESYIQQATNAGASNINIATTCVAMKFFMTRVLKQPWQLSYFPRIHHHRKQRSRPLTRNELSELLKAVRHRCYRVLFLLVYSAGLRISEACALKISDVDLHRFVIYIRDAKGGRHRETVLSRRVAIELEKYLSDRWDQTPSESVAE